MIIKLLATAAVALAATSAQAVVTFYNNQAAFTAALDAFTVEGFANSTLEPGLSFTFTGTSPTITGGKFRDRIQRNVQTTTFLFGPAVNGFGATFDLTPAGPGHGIEVTLGTIGGDTVVVPVIGALGPQFWGWISDVKFISAKFAAPATTPNKRTETYTVDNLIFGTVVPEPGSWAMMIMGLGLVGVGLRRRKTNVVTA